MDWGAYEVFDPGVDRPLHELSRAEARAAFDRVMACRYERIEQLRRLARANGADLGAPDGIDQLDAWFRSSVEPSPSDPERLANVWYSVVNDIGLLLGERMIERSPHLRWELWTHDKRGEAYQRHVLVGFPVKNRAYCVDPDLRVVAHAYQVVDGDEVDPDFFQRELDTIQRLAARP